MRMKRQLKQNKLFKGPQILPPSELKPAIELPVKRQKVSLVKPIPFVDSVTVPKDHDVESIQSTSVEPLTFEKASNRIVQGDNIFGWSTHSLPLDPTEELLRRFDMETIYGPHSGITRLKRYERAKRLGLQPPPEVFDAIQQQLLSA